MKIVAKIQLEDLLTTHLIIHISYLQKQMDWSSVAFFLRNAIPFHLYDWFIYAKNAFRRRVMGGFFFEYTAIYRSFHLTKWEKRVRY